MAVVEIPFSNKYTSVSEEVTLDGVPYRLVFTYNTRGDFWVLSIYDRELTPLVVGIKVVLAFELIRTYPDRGLPPGELYIVDTSESIDRPGRYTLGSELSIMYVEEDTVDSI